VAAFGQFHDLSAGDVFAEANRGRVILTGSF
jgi:hypothetical protein